LPPQSSAATATAGAAVTAGAAAQQVLDRVLTSLVNELSRKLGSAADPDESLLNLGADSIVLFQITSWIRKNFGVSIPVNLFFQEFSTLRQVGEFISARARPEALAGIEPEPTITAVAPAVTTASAEAVIDAAATSPRDTVEYFLQVHERVMGEAFSLLSGTQPSPVVVTQARETPPIQHEPSMPEAPAHELAPHKHGKDQRVGNSPDGFVAFRAEELNRAGIPSGGAYVREVVREFTARTAGSQRRAAEERVHVADMLHVPSLLDGLWATRYPIVLDRSQGCRVWDTDGNEYVDIAMGFGVNLFGHGESFIQDAITAQLRTGMQLAGQPRLVAEVAELLSELTAKQRVVFCNTGSEAVMTALRLARAVTGRRLVVIFTGSYHGSADPVLARAGMGGALGDSTPLAPGVPDEISSQVLVLPYGEEAALEVIEERADEIAAVLVEPVQSRRPGFTPIEFLRRLRKQTETAEIALIFDEVITGFRSHPGGFQAMFGIEADITTYGKVLGGGLPMGVVAGCTKFLDAIDGGAWAFDDKPYPASILTFFTGTFCKHPLALAAARAVLQELKDRGPALQEELNSRTADMATRLNKMFGDAGVPIQVAHFGSLFRFEFPGQPALSELVELFYLRLLTHGLYLWYGRNCFLSTAHNAADIDAIVVAVARSVGDLIGYGLFPDASAEALADHVPAQALPELARVERDIIEITGDLQVCDD
jgi:glutamate-1-semialdehyde aminotransferase/acyl carrier protein